VMKTKIKIDVVSDVVCPWCYIGKRRLEKAVNELSSTYDFDIEYHPFELNPTTPESGFNQREYLTKKFGGEDRFNELTNRVKGVAAEEGLHLDFTNQPISPNTRKAHSIIQAAREEGKQPAVNEAFMKAYFTDGVDLSKDANLIDVAVKAGMSKERVEKVLTDENAPIQIALAEQELSKLGISGVPFFIINNKYGVSGAQSAETFIKAFQEIGVEKV
jgi:predicted DsbA family dithiol-disulfide isomerase